MHYERCPSCHGKKVLMGLGSMIKSCKACNGVGHIKPEVVEVKKRKSKESLVKE